MKDSLRQYHIQYKAKREKLRDSLFGTHKYKKFVIVSDSRTGSTLLMQLLNSHPEIITLGEEFKDLNQLSCKESWRNIFRRRPKKINWVGFKLFYFHPRKSMDREVWDLIESDKRIVIIHLTRQNILRSYVSKKIGLKTRKWTESVNLPLEINEEDKKVKLEPAECRKNF